LCPGSAWISGVFVRCSATIEKLSGSEPARLSPKAAKLLTRRDQPLAFSLASLWEVAIKTSLDRPGFSVDPALLHKALLHEGFQELPIRPQHVVRVAKLPWIHRDPFDRLRVAQAAEEKISLLTADETLRAYGRFVRLI
jgi:PIN domain nuclease of toxin-antitoxin system